VDQGLRNRKSFIYNITNIMILSWALFISLKAYISKYAISNLKDKTVGHVDFVTNTG
jgi:hypothetical protein